VTVENKNGDTALEVARNWGDEYIYALLYAKVSTLPPPPEKKGKSCIIICYPVLLYCTSHLHIVLRVVGALYVKLVHQIYELHTVLSGTAVESQLSELRFSKRISYSEHQKSNSSMCKPGSFLYHTPSLVTCNLIFLRCPVI